jgi:hypothetical protein
MEEFPPGANAYDVHDEIDFTSDAYAFIDQGNLGGAAAPLPLPQDNVHDEIDFTEDAYAFIDQDNLGGAAAPLPLPQDNVQMTDPGGDELDKYFNVLMDEGSGATPGGGGSVEASNDLFAAPAEGPVEPEVGEMAALLAPAAAAARTPYKRKLCAVDGCEKRAIGAAGFCIRHGGGRRCAAGGCQTAAQGSTKFCVRHGGGQRCAQDGCKTSARGTTGFCRRHNPLKRKAVDELNAAFTDLSL